MAEETERDDEGPLSKIVRKDFEATKLATQLTRQFKAMDVEIGGESSLTCLDITTAVHRAVNDYIKEHEERVKEL